MPKVLQCQWVLLYLKSSSTESEEGGKRVCRDASQLLVK